MYSATQKQLAAMLRSHTVSTVLFPLRVSTSALGFVCVTAVNTRRSILLFHSFARCAHRVASIDGRGTGGVNGGRQNRVRTDARRPGGARLSCQTSCGSSFVYFMS